MFTNSNTSRTRRLPVSSVRALSLIVALGVAASAGCKKDPDVSEKTEVKEDGVHVRLFLHDIEEVTVAGRTVKDDEPFVLPFSDFELGANRLPIEGEGLQDASLYVEIGFSHLASVDCGSDEGRKDEAMGGLKTEFASLSTYGDTSWKEYACPIEGGVLRAPLKLAKGVKLEIEGGEVREGTLEIDLRPVLWSMPLEEGEGNSTTIGEGKLSRKLTLRWGDKQWVGDLAVSNSGNLLAEVLNDAPASLSGRPTSKGRRSAAYQADGFWYLAGKGTKVGDVDLFVRLVEEGTAKLLDEECDYVSTTGPVSLKVRAVPQTFAAFDRQGKEVARKTFEPSGCPLGTSIEPGQTIMTLVPGNNTIKAWTQSLIR